MPKWALVKLLHGQMKVDVDQFSVLIFLCPEEKYIQQFFSWKLFLCKTRKEVHNLKALFLEQQGFQNLYAKSSNQISSKIFCLSRGEVHIFYTTLSLQDTSIDCNAQKLLVKTSHYSGVLISSSKALMLETLNYLYQLSSVHRFCNVDLT